ncbi:queuosine precursor transporter [Savagea faecisuis]|uniref:Probable queuosine precursor transporter n=1 Tax=Savagea faecisuis TaxID=1274803 RepID=A0ABW3GYP0_9BACL
MLQYLTGIFVGLLLLSNVIAVKLIAIGDWVVLPAAVIIYVFTYPILDVITETYGKKYARRTVFAGLIAQVFALGFIWIAIRFPAAPFYENQQAFELIFAGSFRVTLASLIAYAVSQNIDVIIFDRLKKRHGTKKLWLRNNASTMVSQFADTAIFILIAFTGTMPIQALLIMIASQYIFKFIVAILDTPIVYGLVYVVRNIRKKEDERDIAMYNA